MENDFFNTENDAYKEQSSQKNMKKEVGEWVRSIVLAIVIAVVIRMFFFETFLVDGTSMFPTLQHNERLVVNKAVYYFREPQEGEIIVFNYQPRPRRDFIKRVVATEGDTVEIRDGDLLVNDQVVEEPYIKKNSMRDFGPVEIPEEHLFVLGDNRNNSMDSRDKEVGAVSLEQVRGKALVVFWPPFEVRALGEES